MRTLYSYILIICLTLSSFTGSVAYAYSPIMAASANQHQLMSAIAPTQSNHSMHQSPGFNTDVAEDHDCCMQDQQHCDDSLCDNDTCPQHCAVATAILHTNLFSYIPATTASNEHILSLASWLFFKDPPPPINT